MENISLISQKSLYLVSKYVYVFCIENQSYDFQLSSCSCICVKGRKGHISLPTSLHERRIVLFAESVVNKLENVTTPCMIQVTQSADMKFVTSNGDTQESVIIWHAEIVNQGTRITTAIDHTKASDIRGMELISDPNIKCNCTFLITGQKVILPIDLKDQKKLNNNLEDQQNLNNDSDLPVSSSTSTETFPCLFKLKGVSYDCYQPTMLKCRQELQRRHLEMKLEFEPEHAEDRNAIKFQVLLDDWEDVGYVDVSMIPKVTSAIKNNEICEVKMISVYRKYIKPVGAMRYVGECLINKRGVWGADVPSFKYNDRLPSN